MSNVRNMIDAIASENFDEARGALTASLAEYMAGRKFVSNKDVFGDDYTNPNEEEQEMKAELTESEMVHCEKCDNVFDMEKSPEGCPKCGNSDTDYLMGMSDEEVAEYEAENKE